MFQTHSHLQTIVGFITVLSVTAINMVEQQVIHTAIMVPNWFGSWRTEAKNWREQLTNWTKKAKDDSHKHTRVVESNEEEENDVLQVTLQKPKKPGPALHHHCKLPRWGSQLSPLLWPTVKWQVRGLSVLNEYHCATDASSMDGDMWNTLHPPAKL